MTERGRANKRCSENAAGRKWPSSAQRGPLEVAWRVRSMARASVFGGNGGLRTTAPKGDVGAVVIPGQRAPARRGVGQEFGVGGLAVRAAQPRRAIDEVHVIAVVGELARHRAVPDAVMEQ